MLADFFSSLLACGRQSGKLVRHRVDSSQIVSYLVVAAPLAVGKPEAARGIGVAGSSSAQVDHGGQILLLPECDCADPSRSYGTRDASIQQRRGQLDGMAWYDAAVEAIEPTGIRVVPRAILDHTMVMDTVAIRFLERPVRNLIHAHRARCRLVESQGVPRQMPPPVGSCHRIPSALNLRQRRQQLGRDDRCCMCTEERAVLLPRFGRVLVE